MAKSLGLLGRPVYQITPEVLKRVEELASKLYSKAQIAACLGINVTTLISKLKDYPNFSEAFDRGWNKGLENEAETIEKVKQSLIINATTPAIDKDGNAVGYQGGDTKAQIFIMKAKAGWTDQKLEISGNPDKPILIAPLFKSDYSKDVNLFLQEDDNVVDA